MPDIGTMTDHIEDLMVELREMRKERDLWRRAAQQLARDLGDIKYADAAYEDAVEYKNGIPYA